MRKRWNFRHVESKVRCCSSSGPLWISDPAVLVDYSADELFGVHLSQRRGFVHVADDLSAEQPHIVDMVWMVLFDGPDSAIEGKRA